MIFTAGRVRNTCIGFVPVNSYPWRSGLHHWYRDNQIVTQMPTKKIWGVWINQWQKCFIAGNTNTKKNYDDGTCCIPITVYFGWCRYKGHLLWSGEISGLVWFSFFNLMSSSSSAYSWSNGWLQIHPSDNCACWVVALRCELYISNPYVATNGKIAMNKDDMVFSPRPFMLSNITTTSPLRKIYPGSC